MEIEVDLQREYFNLALTDWTLIQYSWLFIHGYTYTWCCGDAGSNLCPGKEKEKDKVRR